MPTTALFGPYGSQALQHGERLAEYGCNAVWFHGFDERAFDACARHDLAPCVEFKTFRANYDEHPELVPIGADGQPLRRGRLFQGVCLSQRGFVDRIAADLLAGVQRYQPTGIWLDYLTYGGWFEVPDPDLQESCFCPACIAEFCEATGVDAATPQAILAHHAGAWARHKGERVAGYATQYAAIIREHLPDCLIGAYMCPWAPDEFDGALKRIFAQDYALLAPSIDVFTPLIYAAKCGRAPGWAAEVLTASAAWVPAGRKVQLILDALDFPASLQAAAASPAPSWGVQMYGGADLFVDPTQARQWADAIAQMRGNLEGGACDDHPPLVR